jgi:hypothetical protein
MLWISIQCPARSHSRRLNTYLSRNGLIFTCGFPLAIKSATIFPVPQAIVQPKFPWPTLRYKFFTGEGPSMGSDDGVIGRKPAQYLAAL